MLLEIGKRYFTRDGRVSGPVKANKGDDSNLFPFKATISGVKRTFRSDGRYCYPSNTANDAHSPYDLIGEYIQPPVHPPIDFQQISAAVKSVAGEVLTPEYVNKIASGVLAAMEGKP